MARFRVEIFSDNVCPWCYVGKRNLETAIRQRPEATYNVQWKPFFLDLKSPDDGGPIMPHLLAKYGELRGRRMIDALAQAGERAGIHFTEKRNVTNTLKSHKLVRLAGEQGKQDAVIERLFSSYFEEGKNINDVAELCRIAEEAGVTGAREELAGTESDERVVEEYKEGVRKHRISGVPYFIISREGNAEKLTLSGAQPPEEFLEAFEALS